MAIFPGAKHLARHQAGRPPTVDLHALLERIFLQSYISAVQLIVYRRFTALEIQIADANQSAVCVL